jgi:hypothetical protein
LGAQNVCVSVTLSEPNSTSDFALGAQKMQEEKDGGTVDIVTNNRYLLLLRCIYMFAAHL